MIDRAALLRAEALEAPDRLARLLDSWDAGPIARGAVRFVGLGSSRFASQVVAATLGADGRVARVQVASLDPPPPPIPGETVFAVSASGRTPEVVAVARALRDRCAVVAVTNDPASPLAEAAPTCLALHAGREASGIASATYRATLAVLALATGVTTIEALRGVAASLGGVDRETISAQVRLLDVANSVDVVASTELLGAAEQAALMLREAPRLRAAAWDAAEWLHTAIYTALPGHVLLVLGDSPYRDELATTVQGRGGTVVHLPGPAGAAPLQAALSLSAGVERLAADLWTLALGSGESGSL